MNQNDVINVLNDLIETSKDGEYGFQSCAEHAKSPALQDVFLARANECQAAVSELQVLVSQCGATPGDGGSVSGALHRGWVAVRGTLAGYTDTALLNECERGEDVAKARYQKALEKPLPEPIRTIIARQFQGVVRNHDQIHLLRDRYREAA